MMSLPRGWWLFRVGTSYSQPLLWSDITTSRPSSSSAAAASSIRRSLQVSGAKLNSG